MSAHRNILKKLTLSTFLLSSVVFGAHAQDAAAVAERMKQLLALQGTNLSWSSISGEGANFSLEGVKVGFTGQPDALEIGKLSFEGVADDNGGFAIDTVTTEAYTKTQDGMTFEISPFKMTGVKLPAQGSTDPIANLVFYEAAELASLNVKMGDKTAFSLENLTAEITPPSADKAMEFTGGAEKFSADLTLVTDPQAKAAIEAMGYQAITGSLDLEGSWNPADGRMDFSTYDITVDNAGTFGMTFDIGGYTPDFIRALQEVQKQMAAQPAGADDSAQGLAMLGLMQQLTFHSASMRWDDDSLTGKAIDYIAKMQNMKPEDIKNQAKAIVPFLTAQLNNPDLSAAITAAVTKYLDDPQSIEVSAEPAAPVPFSQIAAAGMANPVDLTKSLGVTVTANEDE
ncbi:hypothetical protein RB623_12960 [Mesorhizobium sp. LHD-90]|uniref:hypothetical protein n=1 Tax=Mesorhizobium sp. LHD-90 TaxID=3071414 RepID=UPI0027E0F318|nr:hypothetical protein [Mesorhizobium sp. LHD-90]MDQ6434960.1 hypothetical protein [Mesorhizobium sp. LHD-90]